MSASAGSSHSSHAAQSSSAKITGMRPWTARIGALASVVTMAKVRMTGRNAYVARSGASSVSV